jgi:hypothetical protein
VNATIAPFLSCAARLAESKLSRVTKGVFHQAYGFAALHTGWHVHSYDKGLCASFEGYELKINNSKRGKIHGKPHYMPDYFL